MKAHVIENGVIVNTIEVESIDFMPNLVEATEGGIGWLYNNGEFTPPKNTIPDEKKAEFIRSRRNFLLKETDWTQLADAPLDKSVWAIYRQELRDITLQAGFPNEIEWPQKP